MNKTCKWFRHFGALSSGCCLSSNNKIPKRKKWNKKCKKCVHRAVYTGLLASIYLYIADSDGKFYLLIHTVMRLLADDVVSTCFCLYLLYVSVCFSIGPVGTRHTITFIMGHDMRICTIWLVRCVWWFGQYLLHIQFKN